MLTFRILPSQTTNQPSHRTQTDDNDIVFFKSCYGIHQIYQHPNSQRANSVSTSDVFSIIYSYVSLLEAYETFCVSPPQAYRNAIERREINLFSQFVDSICETITDIEALQKTKNDLQRLLAWFKIVYFQHNLDLIAQARKHYRLQGDEETMLADEIGCVWDPVSYHDLIFLTYQLISPAHHVELTLYIKVA